MWLFILALFVPICIAWVEGSSYAFGASVTVVGIVFIVVGTMLEKTHRKKITSQMPEKQKEIYEKLGMSSSQIRIYTTLNVTPWWLDPIEPLDFVPKWIIAMELVGFGFVPAGIVTTILLWVELIENLR